MEITANQIKMAKKIQAQIAERLLSVTTEHTENEHFYRLPSGRLVPSVTGKLQVLKDPALANWKMNQALGFIKEFCMEHGFEDGEQREDFLDNIIEKAKQRPGDIFRDAGDVGTRIHDARERYFDAWIKSEVKPLSIQSFKAPGEEDPRVTSGLAGIEAFVNRTGYLPVACELKVYDEQLGIAGTLDDIGIMPVMVEGKRRNQLVLLDLKTSNLFKNHYHYQVALYYVMFYKLTKIKPKQAFILKVDKNFHGSYELEYLKGIPQLFKEAVMTIHLSDAQDRLRDSRKKPIVDLRTKKDA